MLINLNKFYKWFGISRLSKHIYKMKRLKKLKENKELRAAICNYLPYKIKVSCFRDDKLLLTGIIQEFNPSSSEMVHIKDNDSDIDIWENYQNIKLCLRPVSDMDEEEINTLFKILGVSIMGDNENWIKINDCLGIKFFFPEGIWVEDLIKGYDYLNSIHIDYRNLESRKLAYYENKILY